MQTSFFFFGEDGGGGRREQSDKSRNALIRYKQISISVTKCPQALLANFYITCVSKYRQLTSQSVPQMLLFKSG